ncbi:caspase domain-containing protein [Rhizobium sp. NPDC090279]|uniref:caspase family protein n=1 Tax=Rhizobium sp. NPDC090279 TaxID=3364499 RepID=UPI00383A173B
MKRYAFVTGNPGPGTSAFSTLECTANDQVAVSRAFSSPRSAFDVIQTSGDYGPADVIAEFERVASSCGPGDSLVFYFTGHGLLSKSQLYLVWGQTEFDRPVSTAIPISSIRSIFANTRASLRLMILDCCHSGAATEQIYKSAEATQGEPLMAAARDGASLILAACGRTAVARELPEIGLGFLTHMLCLALENRFEDADRDGDGLLSITDLVGWTSDQTDIFNSSRHLGERLARPELYGEMRGDVYLTARRILPSDSMEEKLQKEVWEAVEKLRNAYLQFSRVPTVKLQQIARPIKRAAPTFRRLHVLEDLFKASTSEAIFAAAVILQIRRDPLYMEKLITQIDNFDLRGSARWRVLRAVRDTLPAYTLSPSGFNDLLTRLERIIIADPTARDRPAEKGENLHMIFQIARKMKIDAAALFTRLGRLPPK